MKYRSGRIPDHSIYSSLFSSKNVRNLREVWNGARSCWKELSSSRKYSLIVCALYSSRFAVASTLTSYHGHLAIKNYPKTCSYDEKITSWWKWYQTAGSGFIAYFKWNAHMLRKKLTRSFKMALKFFRLESHWKPIGYHQTKAPERDDEAFE